MPSKTSKQKKKGGKPLDKGVADKSKGIQNATLQFLYRSYVKVRDDTDGGRLCRVEQSVYSTSRWVRVRWLSSVGGDEYLLDEDTRDKIDPARIVTKINITEVALQKRLKGHRSETETVLKVSDAAITETFPAVGSDENTSMEPPSKKMKLSTKTEQVKKKGRPNNKKRTAHDESSKAETTKRKTAKKKDDLSFYPNRKVAVHKEDPLFQSREPLPFVSQYSDSRLVFRAVHTGQHKLLKKIIKKGNVRELSHWRSVADPTTALHHAISMKQKQSIKLLYKDFYSTEANGTRSKRLNRVMETKVIVKPLETGTSFEFRPITASRGGKEGNNALLKDLGDMEDPTDYHIKDYTDHMLKEGLDFETMREMMEDEDFMACSSVLRRYSTNDMYPERYKDPSVFFYIYYNVLKNIDLALRQGHYELAGKLLRHMAENPRFKRKIPPIFFDVLLSTSDLPSTSLRQATLVIKLAKRLTPLHLAACNPDIQHLEKLLKITDINVNLPDVQDRRPLHFAAACGSTEPMALLINSGANVFLRDRQGDMPFHFAVGANRLENVKFLIEAASKQKEKCYITADGHADGGEDDVTDVLIHHANKRSYRPIHIAAEHGYPAMTELLLKYGADANSTLKLSLSKLTPLMLAAQFSFYHAAVLLVENGATVQKKDRLGRSAVIHAAMNGNTNVLSYLLNIGANPNLCDNSGNSPLHYAAAYGWFFCVQTLLQAGADVNVVNDWKVSPLTSAYMKTHTGIVTLLLQQKNLNVNFADDAGKLLLTTAVSSVLCPELFDQVKYLVKDKGAVCEYRDSEGCSPLHILAANDTILDATLKYKRPNEEAMDISVEIARLLLEHGADIQAVTDEMNTPAMEAMIKGNIKLFKFLVEAGGRVIPEPDPSGQDILYYLCTMYMDSYCDYLGIIKYAASQDGTSGTQNLRKDFQKMARAYSYCDKTGFTPLLVATRWYLRCTIKCEENSTEEEKVLQRSVWERGREFIRVLIDEFESDIDAPVLASKDLTPYENRVNMAGWTAVHTLSSLDNCEYGGLREEHESEWPGLRMLLRYKPDVNTRDADGCTPLIWAVDDHRKPAIRLLLTEGNADPNCFSIDPEDENCAKIPASIFSVDSDDADTLKMLIDAGTDVDAVDERDGESLLHAAVQRGKDEEVTLEMVKLLLDNGAKVSCVSKHQRTPLHLAVENCKGKMDDSFDVIITLVERGGDLAAQDIRGRTPLHYVFVKFKKHTDSTQQDPVELLRILASRMTPAELNIQDKFGMTALHRAAFRGANICCMYLLQKGADITIKDEDGNTPLAMAVIGHDGCATMLIQKGANLKISVVHGEDAGKKKETAEDEGGPAWKLIGDEKEDGEKQSPCVTLFVHALEKQLQGVLYMIMEKPFKESGLTFNDALESGLQLKMYNVVLRLLATTADTSSLKKSFKHGGNLLHVLSLTATPDDSNVNVEKVATALIENGVPLQKQDAFKCTPLLYAALRRNVTLGRFYLKYPKVYNPHYTDKFGRTVLSASIWKISKEPDPKLIEWVGELIKLGANINERTAFPLCRILDDSSVADYWTDHSSKKVSPLIVAISYQNFSLARWMLNNGADADLADEEGVIPLMHAVRVNDLNLVKLLLNFEFDPDAKEEEKPEETLNTVRSRAFQLKTKLSVVSFSNDKEDMETSDETAEMKGQPFEAFKKTSKVNLTTADKNGWTVIHHLVCPLSFGTFDNDEMVFILAKAGARLNVKNKKGETPLDLALRHGAFKIAKIIQELEGVPEKKRVEPWPLVEDTIPDINSDEPLFRDDARRYKEELGVNEDVEIKFEPEINSECEARNGQLVKDEDQGRLYNVLLGKVDANAGKWGLYNFYQMQLVRPEGKDIYILFTRWGRIHYRLLVKFQQTPFNTKQEAVREFCMIFKEKTGNKWTEVNSFSHQTRKYRMAQEGKRTVKGKIPDVDLEVKSNKESNLLEQVKTLLGELMNPTSLKEAYSKTCIDKDVLPLVHLEKERITKIWNLLQKISEVMVNLFVYRDKETKESDEEIEKRRKDKYQRDCEQVWRLSEEMFQLIPEDKFVFEERQPIDDYVNLADFRTVITNLRHYELTLQMILAAKYREKDMHPLDYVVQCLPCHIEPLSEADLESQYILKYIKCSAPKTKVECIFSLNRKGERSRMNERSLGDHRLLFHGGGASTILSLLHGGLVCSPLRTNTDKQMYGKGIPFCDTFVKTARYCDNINTKQETRFMLLCEVALGECKKYSERSWIGTETEREYNSANFMGRMQPGPTANIRLTSGPCQGCMLPLGEMKTNDYHEGKRIQNDYNKFAVFEESQVCLRYLIQFRK